jgi:hypothetical protein
MKTTTVIILAACAALCGCAGVVVAQSITAVSETVSGNAVQHKAVTPAQLATLATDLGALPGTPLPSTDNVLIANIISEALAKKQADLTASSAVDAINGALNAVIAGHAPTAADGVAWANLQDVVLGMKNEGKLLAANPLLVPTS